MELESTHLIDNIKYLGNKELLNLHKTAFLCSRRIPARAVLACYNWAIEMRNKEQCIISGFHSSLEKDVLDILIRGHQPIIVALARGLFKKTPTYFQKAFEEKRLLIISIFDDRAPRASTQTAEIRNRLMLELADDIVVGYCSEKGMLNVLLEKINIPIKYLIK